MILAMAGLPGTGKSTLAMALAEKLPAVVLNKDVIRAALFTADAIEYSTQQDDFVVGIMLKVADYYLQKNTSYHIILDGRTFSKKEQINTLVEFCQDKKYDLRVIYCTCSDDVARTRIERDVAAGEHLAADRNFDLYLKLKSQSDPLQVPHLRVDTGEPLAPCIKLCISYLRDHSENTLYKKETK
jgi:predicted kinase